MGGVDRQGRFASSPGPVVGKRRVVRGRSSVLDDLVSDDGGPGEAMEVGAAVAVAEYPSVLPGAVERAEVPGEYPPGDRFVRVAAGRPLVGELPEASHLITTPRRADRPPTGPPAAPRLAAHSPPAASQLGTDPLEAGNPGPVLIQPQRRHARGGQSRRIWRCGLWDAGVLPDRRARPFRPQRLPDPARRARAERIGPHARREYGPGHRSWRLQHISRSGKARPGDDGPSQLTSASIRDRVALAWPCGCGLPRLALAPGTADEWCGLAARSRRRRHSNALPSARLGRAEDWEECDHE